MAFPSTQPPTGLVAGQFAYNAVTLGPGTPYRITQIDGIDMPAVRSSDAARSRDSGELIGLDLLGGRDITLDFDIQPYSGISIQTALLNLGSATEPAGTTEQPLWFSLPGLPPLAAMARPRKRNLPIDKSYVLGALVQNCALQFHATDPRLYSAPSSVTVGLTNPTVGATFPLRFPIIFGVTQPNAVTVTNTGNSEMRPLLTINGPCTNPSVENSTLPGAPAITISNPNQTSYTVQTGDQLVIDMDLHSVLYYSGGVNSGLPPANQRAWVVPGSQWWDLVPGGNTIRFSSSDGSSVSGTLTVTWSSAYVL